MSKSKHGLARQIISNWNCSREGMIFPAFYHKYIWQVTYTVKTSIIFGEKKISAFILDSVASRRTDKESTTVNNKRQVTLCDQQPYQPQSYTSFRD